MMTNKEKALAFRERQEAGFGVMMARKKAERVIRDQALTDQFHAFLDEQEEHIAQTGELKPLQLCEHAQPKLPHPSTPQTLGEVLKAFAKQEGLSLAPEPLAGEGAEQEMEGKNEAAPKSAIPKNLLN